MTKTKKPLKNFTHVMEIEINVAIAWLKLGAIKPYDIGNENTYYLNEFGHKFFCKNYPTANFLQS